MGLEDTDDNFPNTDTSDIEYREEFSRINDDMFRRLFKGLVDEIINHCSSLPLLKDKQKELELYLEEYSTLCTQQDETEHFLRIKNLFQEIVERQERKLSGKPEVIEIDLSSLPKILREKLEDWPTELRGKNTYEEARKKFIEVVRCIKALYKEKVVDESTCIKISENFGQLFISRLYDLCDPEEILNNALVILDELFDDQLENPLRRHMSGVFTDEYFKLKKS